MKKLFFIFLLLLSYTINFTTLAEVRFVSKTGSSTPPYTSWQTAADSIQKCINICDTGDTVVVANGVYKETLLIETEITLLGSSMDSCIIDGTGLDGPPIFGQTGITIRAEKFLTIKNFHIKGRKWEPLTQVLSTRAYGGDCKNLNIENAYNGISVKAGNSNVANCFIKNISYAISTSSDTNIDTFYINNNLVINNKDNGEGVSNGFGGYHFINNNIFLGIHPSCFDGIQLLDKKSVLKNNLIANYHDNNYDGAHYSQEAIIENNVFIQNDHSNNYDNIEIVQGPGTKIRNNIIAYSDRMGILSNRDTFSVDYNLFWKNNEDVDSKIILGENNVFADPMFVKDTIPNSTSNYDFHLQAYSPAIDAGDPSILDKDGSRSDIGMYGGPGGESYTYQDLAPKPPRNLTASVDSVRIYLNWLKNTEADFYQYRVYRDTIPNFIYDTTKIIAVTSDTTFSLLLTSNNNMYFKITAIDNQNNQSPASEEAAILVTSSNDHKLIANDYRFYQNYPNPFNPSTTLSYRLKENSYVRLVIYDIKGERVTELVNNYQPKGYYEVDWNAKGNGLSSGIYLFKIEIRNENNIPVFSDMKKSILLK